MAAFIDFLNLMFRTGEVVFRERPVVDDRDRSEANALLGRAYAEHELHVAGPSLEYQPMLANQASELLWRACWYLVQHDEPEEELSRWLVLPPPQSPADHLSADLVLRFLPQVYRRARALAPDDRLTTLLADLLRQWPLSGVLADLDEEPTTPLDFGGHRGLLLLYAERLAEHEKCMWLPAGLALEHVERAYQELGKTLPVHPAPLLEFLVDEES